MDLWLVLPFLPTGRLRELAVLAEELGLAGVAVGDHVCVPADVSSIYPYSGKTAELPVGTEFPDPLVLAASLGGATTRLRFMTYVLLVPLRHPVLLAKEIATTAVLTDGRLDLGVGVGWLREEFDALDVPFERRGSRMDESLPLLRALWSGEPVEHRGTHFSWDALAVHPVPPAPVQVFVGGYSEAALRRAARLGDGWVAVNPDVDQLHELLGRLDDLRREAGRADEPFEIRTGLKGRVTPERLQGLQKLGVAAFFASPWQLDDSRTWIYDVTVERVADALPGFVERFRSALDS